MDKSPESLNRKLRDLRIEKEVSQAKWAKAAGVHTSQVGRWESDGKGIPDVFGLKGIADLLGIKLAALVGDEQPQYAAPREPTPEEMLLFIVKRMKLKGPRADLIELALSVSEDTAAAILGPAKKLVPVPGASDHKAKPAG